MMNIQDIFLNNQLDNKEQQIFYEYCRNRFAGVTELTAPDEDFLKTWDRIVDYEMLLGPDRAINDLICSKSPVDFKSPGEPEIKIVDSFAGRIPVICVRNTEDFENLVTNLVYKGVRPDNISETGAFFIYGRITRFIILSAKPYSNVPASELGLDDENQWREQSILLRQGHECTHYFTKRTYGITNNILHDELMADFTGMYETFGFYKAEWSLRFMGIMKGSGGRLKVYTEGLSENVRSAVSELAAASSYSLERWSQTEPFKNMTTSERIKTMCRAGLEGMIQLA